MTFKSGSVILVNWESRRGSWKTRKAESSFSDSTECCKHGQLSAGWVHIKSNALQLTLIGVRLQMNFTDKSGLRMMFIISEVVNNL